MRNPLRIKRILNKIETAWAAAPDLRFNQLILNIIPSDSPPVFYLEDKDFEFWLDRWLENRNLTNTWKS